MSKSELVLALLVATGCFGVSVPAISAPRVAVINIQSVIDSSALGKAARAELQAELQGKQQKLFQVGSDLNKLREDVQKQSGLLSAEALERKQEQLKVREREVARQMEDERAQIRESRDRAIARLVTQIDEIVKKLAARDMYDFVIERDGSMVVYADPRLDISASVVKALDATKR